MALAGKPDMKIVIVIPEYKIDTVDHFFHMYQLIEKIAQKHQVVLIAEAGDIKCRIKHLSEYKVQSIADSRIKRLIERFFWFIRYSLKGYNNYYCHYCEISTILLWFISIFSNGIVIKWHCSQQDLYRKKFSLKTLKHKFIVELPIEFSIRVAHVLVTCTPQMKSYYQKQFSRKESSIFILPNYICLADFESKKVSSLKMPIHLLFVHRMSPRKGADRLIEYAFEIKELHLPFKITAVGDGPLYKSLVNIAIKNNVANILEFKGKVPNYKIKELYGKADFLLMPSRDEEFGRVQIEAMKYGLPILAPKTLSSSFVLSKLQQKYTVDQGNFLQLLNNALELFSNPDEYQKLVTEGYAQVQKFSLRVAVENFNNLLATYGKS